MAKSPHPIWRIMKHQQRTLIWLAERTGYSHSHVKGVAASQWPASPAFRAKCTFALDLPEDVLFIAEPSEPESAPVEPEQVLVEVA